MSRVVTLNRAVTYRGWLAMTASKSRLKRICVMKGRNIGNDAFGSPIILRPTFRALTPEEIELDEAREAAKDWMREQGLKPIDERASFEDAKEVEVK